MLETLLVRHCSPTLAGIKTGSLFTCCCACYDDIQQEIDDWNRLLNPKGLKFVLLRQTEDKATIYVYRPQKLAKDIAHAEVKDFLISNGYSYCDTEHCICQLSRRLKESQTFPHEIGLFLGYPLPDVKAFIENNGKNYKCLGYWKAYTDENEAKKIFAKYKKCTSIYWRKFLKEKSILQLTVVA